jgi:dihydrofolate reductase
LPFYTRQTPFARIPYEYDKKYRMIKRRFAMGTINAGFSMSLDGFIAGTDDDVQRLFAWMSLGDTKLDVSSGDTEFDLQMSSEDAKQYKEMATQTGAIVSGRRMFDVAGAWGGKHPMGVPVVVLTHSIPEEWDYEGSPFTFVTDGVESAIEKARNIAGEKNIGVGGADITRPVLLGQGVPLFEYLGIEPVELESTGVRQSPGVIHLSFRVVE